MTLVGVALVVAACSTDDPAVEEASTTSAAPPVTATTTTTQPTEALDAAPTPPAPEVDRLVIISVEGDVISMDRSGSDRLFHNEVGEIPMQPIWDPSGERISYSLRGPDPALVVAAADGTGREVVELPSNPFYLYWSHDGRRLASLRNSAIGLAFEIFDVTGVTPAVEFTDNGSPYYFDWSPDGADLVAHVGTDRLDLWRGTEFEAAGPAPGSFAAPQWHDAGVLAPVGDSGAQRVVVVGPDGTIEPIVDVEGAIRFELESSAERLLALEALGESEGNAVEAALQIVEEIPTNELVVIDVEDGTVSVAHDAPALAFFWSPYGERLLFLTPDDQPGLARWNIWEDGMVTEGPRFAPFQQWFAEFIPFFEQYARSMSLWSPDGTAYAFPGIIGSELGIWVADAAGGEPSLIAAGVWVSWSQN